MNRQDITIATITRVRDEAEETLMRESLTHLIALDIPVYITDAGSAASFLQFLRSVPPVQLHNEPVKGVWLQAKHSLSMAAASGSKFIFYTEPDKKDFFKDSLPALLDAVEVSERTGIVVASRSAKAFATFPQFQQMTETAINNCCAEAIGKPVDYTYGPFLLRREIIPHLVQLPDDIEWGWRPFAFNIAKRLDYAVESVTGDFCCPQDQRNDFPAERLYRMKQLEQNIRGLLLSVHTGMRTNSR